MVSAGLVLSKGWEGQYVICLSLSFWWFAGSFWNYLAYGRIIISSAFIFTWNSSCVFSAFPLCVQISHFCKDTSDSGIGPTLVSSS